ncbi:MAG: DUF4397 domain-containing protein [Polyangiales bacterium]
MKVRWHWLRQWAQLSALVAALVACGDDDDDVTPIDPPPATGTAMVRVVHASPNAPAVNVHPAGAGTAVISDLAFGQASAYVSLGATEVQFDIRAATDDPSTTNPVFTTPPVTLAADKKYTVVAAGLLGSTSADDNFRVLVYEEAFSAPPAAQAQVRVVHASPDAPEVGIDVNSDAVPDTTVARFADSGAAGISLPADQALSLDIWATATSTQVTSFTATLPAGAEAFVIALGQLGGHPRGTAVLAPTALPPDAAVRSNPGFALLAVGPQGSALEGGAIIKQDPVLYALHAAADVGNADIFADTDGDNVTDTEVFDDLIFGELSNDGQTAMMGGNTVNLGKPIQVSPGTYALDVFPHVDGSTKPVDPPALNGSVELMAGERYLAIVSGAATPETGQQALAFVVVKEELDLSDVTGHRLGFVHTATGVGAVDAGATDGTPGAFVGTPLFVNVAYAAQGDATGVTVPAVTPPVAINFGLGLTGGSPIAAFSLTPTIGLRGYVAAVGTNEGGDPNQLTAAVIGTPPFDAGMMDMSLMGMWTWAKESL